MADRFDDQVMQQRLTGSTYFAVENAGLKKALAEAQAQRDAAEKLLAEIHTHAETGPPYAVWQCVEVLLRSRGFLPSGGEK